MVWSPQVKNIQRVLHAKESFPFILYAVSLCNALRNSLHNCYILYNLPSLIILYSIYPVSDTDSFPFRTFRARCDRSLHPTLIKHCRIPQFIGNDCTCEPMHQGPKCICSLPVGDVLEPFCSPCLD